MTFGDNAMRQLTFLEWYKGLDVVKECGKVIVILVIHQHHLLMKRCSGVLGG